MKKIMIVGAVVLVARGHPGDWRLCLCPNPDSCPCRKCHLARA